MLRVLAIALALSSCASIVSKSNWPVTISSNPPGASFTVTDEDGSVVQTGVAPMTMVLSSKEGYFYKADYDIKATLPGHAPANARMSAKLNPWYFGNLLFGGLIGLLIVDPLTGAMWKLGDQFTIHFTAPSAQP